MHVQPSAKLGHYICQPAAWKPSHRLLAELRESPVQTRGRQLVRGVGEVQVTGGEGVLPGAGEYRVCVIGQSIRRLHRHLHV